MSEPLPHILRLGETFYVPEPLHPDHRPLAVEVVPTSNLEAERRARGLEQVDLARSEGEVDRLREAITLMLSEVEGIDVGDDNGCKGAALMVGRRALEARS